MLGTDREQRFRKVGTRRAQAISKVVVAAAWRGTDRGGTCGSRSGRWRRRRSGSARPRRRSRAGRATLASIEAAVDALGAAIQPIDDVRSTAAYRREAARRVVRRLLADSLETS